MYCTSTDLAERFGLEELESVAWDSDAGQLDNDKIERACTDASNQVDLYVGGRIQTPSSTPPPVIVSIACDIARYKLHDDRPLDEVKDRYDAAMRILRDIAAGKASLGEVGQQSSPGAVGTLKGDDDRIFTSETLADF